MEISALMLRSMLTVQALYRFGSTHALVVLDIYLLYLQKIQSLVMQSLGSDKAHCYLKLN